MSVRQQLKLIARGDIDIGFLTVNEKNYSNIRYLNICDEEIVLVIPASHPLAKLSSWPLTVSDIANFKEESFVLMYKESSLRPLIDGLFATAGFKPKVLFETSSNSAIVTIIKSGMCCGVVPYYYVKDKPQGIACFSLPGRPSWSIVACMRSDSYLSGAGRRFVELASEYWNREIQDASV